MGLEELNVTLMKSGTSNTVFSTAEGSYRMIKEPSLSQMMIAMRQRTLKGEEGVVYAVIFLVPQLPPIIDTSDWTTAAK